MPNDFPLCARTVGALTLALLVAPACEPAKRNADSAGTPAPTVDEITDQGASYVGRTVTLTGEVGRVGGPRLFTIEDKDPVGDEHLLVLSERPVMDILEGSKNPLADDDEVQVTGTVQSLVITEVERELGFDIEPEFEVEFRDRPVLVANSVRRIGSGPTESAAASSGTSVTDVLLLVPVPGPRDLAGQPVQLTGVQVQSVVSDKGFWVGPRRDQQVFVRLDETSPSGASTEQKVQVRKGQRLEIFGTVAWVPPRKEVESTWGLSPAESKVLARKEALYIAADSVRTLQS